MLINTANAALTPTPLVSNNNVATSASPVSFSDVLDTINPLQHIPVVSAIYRSLSGSSISDAAKLAGDTLYGLATGNVAVSALASAADIAVKQLTGKDTGTTVIQTLSQKTQTDPVPLIADNSVNGTSDKSADFIPLNSKHTAIAAGQYTAALVNDSVTKKLLKISV